MMKSIAMPLLLVLFLSSSISAQTLGSSYVGEDVPSEGVLIENLKILLGPASRGSGRAGSIQSILGVHYQNDANVYQVYYCYISPKKDYVYGSRGQDGCYHDVIIFRLDSGKWIMRNPATSEWIIISDR